MKRNYKGGSTDVTIANPTLWATLATEDALRRVIAANSCMCGGSENGFGGIGYAGPPATKLSKPKRRKPRLTQYCGKRLRRSPEIRTTRTNVVTGWRSQSTVPY